MVRHATYVVLWAYTAWYAVALGGSLVGAEVVSTISPGMAIVAGIIAGRRALLRQAPT